MCPHRTLKHRNIENISANSVTSDEISTRRKKLAAAERKLKNMEQKILKTKEIVAQSRQRLTDQRNQSKVQNTKQTQRALEAVKKRLAGSRQQRDKMLWEYRELRQIVRDLCALVKGLEKKEAARQVAVARFLKAWERDYDEKMGRKQKNARIRGTYIKKYRMNKVT